MGALEGHIPAVPLGDREEILKMCKQGVLQTLPSTRCSQPAATLWENIALR